MSSLADFLLARITEDEAWARTYLRDDDDDTFASGNMPSTRNRVLAECEAKRRILALHKSGDAWCDHCSGWYGPDPGADCPTLRLLALPYADHADYREEWAL